MNAFVGRAAIIFAGFIVAGVFLNAYILVGTFTVGSILAASGFTPQQELTILYWPCLIGGFVTSFFLMRPAWKSLGKKPAAKEIADTSPVSSNSN